MILVGNRRGGAAELTAHLLNVEDNEHVELHEVRGFMSSELSDALHEAYGISRGTRCKKFLYSLSLSPPQNESVPIEAFEAAITRIEQKLGLSSQPRAIVFHEKKGRRHGHVVWSRINSDTMTAIDPYQDKLTLEKIARELFQEHQWDMPAGFKRKEDTDPLNYSHTEYQQAKRAKRDVKEIKRIFKACWEQSDTRDTFAHALKEHGLILAKGDRRGFVAVDANGEIYSIARYAGVKARELKLRFGNLDCLPDVETARKLFGQIEHAKTNANTGINTKFGNASHNLKAKAELDALELQRLAMVQEHRDARAALHQKQQMRRSAERKAKQAKLPVGLKAIWFKLSGQYETLIAANEKDFAQCEARDGSEQQSLIEVQLSERRALQQKFLTAEQALNAANVNETRFLSLDPEQALVIPPDPDALTIKEKVNQQPEHILKVLTDTRESFTRNDILRALAKYIEDPLKLGAAIEDVMRSPELVVFEKSAYGNIAIKTRHNRNASTRYSTNAFQTLKTELNGRVEVLSENNSTFVSSANINAAIRQQNRKLKSEIGVTLSDQQQVAIQQCLEAKQLSALVGLAGTGKSTILSAVKTALDKQGYKTQGAALSGKAADGLEQASQIKSRTLASWMRSWDQGKSLLTANDVLIIDEAGMIGTKQLLHFVKEVQRSGAKLILVGDPEQLQPINAGTPFKDICVTTNPTKLTEIHRQSQNWHKQASLDLAEQRTEDALKAYELHDKVIKTKDTSEAILRLVEDYMVDLEINGNTTSRLALAHRRKDVHAINQTIRLTRKSAGDLTNEILIQTDHGKRAFAKGDRIVFTKNDRIFSVRNGMLGSVKAIVEIDGNIELKIHIDGEPPKTITINPNYFTAFDHGYATTIHKSQGATVDRAFILASSTMDRHLTYVAMTRHREDAKLYGNESYVPKISTAEKTKNNIQQQHRNEI